MKCWISLNSECFDNLGRNNSLVNEDKPSTVTNLTDKITVHSQFTVIIWNPDLRSQYQLRSNCNFLIYEKDSRASVI